MVRGDEKQFEVTIDRLIEYSKNIKVSLLYFIQRIELEGDTLDWPKVVDSFTTICGQMNTLMRFTRENKSQFIENRVVLPLLLCPDRDEDLVKLTEGRVQMVNHEMVPDYLRTKPDPEIEESEKSFQLKASSISSDAAVKQINAMTKLIDNTINSIKANSVRADSEMSRQSIKPSYNNNDTNELLLAMSSGKGLRLGLEMHGGLPMGHANDSVLSQTPHEPAMHQVPRPNIKAPELKTNIKAGP